ncbi:hypothetical protein [Streptomyces phaeofaciens]|uniref:hypothetical protein n=1 Tax=Streptomyces phaeofaciens TaxID=68254 RepID=UPI00368F80E9
MNDTEVRELLGRAVDTVAVPPGPGGESVFARAAAKRLRRRTAVTTAAAAVVTGGVLLGSGLLPSTTTGNAGGGAAGFEKLLPSDVGTVREVSLGRLLRGGGGPLAGKNAGPHDGEYSVARAGGIGYLTVHVDKGVENPGTDPEPDSCALADLRSIADRCTNERIPGVGLLSIWQTPDTEWAFKQKSAGARAVTVSGGETLSARLRLDDGTMLTLRDATGFGGVRSQGPPLKTYPLTRAQLRKLALSDELLP